MTYVATSHFKDLEAARKYYRYEGATTEDIQAKIQEGAIHLGPPTVKPWESTTLNHEGRYVVKEPAMSHDTIKAINAAGLQVYMRNRSDTWLIFTDGVNVGYMQRAYFGGVTRSTCHVANRECGTGFGLDEGGYTGPITKEYLEEAFITAPSWATPSQRRAVRKYRDIADYCKANAYGDPYELVEE